MKFENSSKSSVVQFRISTDNSRLWQLILFWHMSYLNDIWMHLWSNSLSPVCACVCEHTCLEISLLENMLRIQVKRNYIEKCKKKKKEKQSFLLCFLQFWVCFLCRVLHILCFLLEFLKRAMITLRNSLAIRGFSGSSAGKESTWNAGDLGSIPGLGRSPGEGNVYLLQYSCLENSIDKGAWWATIYGIVELDMIEQLSLHFTSLHFTWLINTSGSYEDEC